MHEFKRAESRKPHASRPLEGSLAMPVEECKDDRNQKRGFQLVLGGLYGSQQQETIEYQLVDGCDDDVEKWLNSISAASLLAAIASNGGMPQYAVEALAVSEEKSLRRERRSRAVSGKSAQSWDACSVASSALSTASTISVASASSRRSCSPLKSLKSPLPASAARSPSAPVVAEAAVAEDASAPPPRPTNLSGKVVEEADQPPLPQPVPVPPATVRHFRRRAPAAALRQSQAAGHDNASIAGTANFREEEGTFDV